MNFSNLHFSISFKNPAKSKCGDASFTGKVCNAGKEWVLLMVADGVSKAPKDWLASASAIELVKEYIESSPAKNGKELLEEALLFANTHICMGIQDTKGMLTTLSALLYHPQDSLLYIANVGDSRIYGFANGDWQQLTEDDATRIPWKENGKLKLQNGVPVYANALTKAIGSDKNLNVQAKEINVADFKGFALVTDGFYGINGWLNQVNGFYHATEPATLAEKEEADILNGINDDASIAMLRMPIPLDDLQGLAKIGASGWSNAVLLPAIYAELDNAFACNDHTTLNRIIDFILFHRITDTKPNMIAFLERLIRARAAEAIPKLTALIRNL